MADRRPLKSRIASKLVVFFASRPPRALRSMAPKPPFPPLSLSTHCTSHGRVPSDGAGTSASSCTSLAPHTSRMHSTPTPLPAATSCLTCSPVAPPPSPSRPGQSTTQALPPCRKRTRIYRIFLWSEVMGGRRAGASCVVWPCGRVRSALCASCAVRRARSPLPPPAPRPRPNPQSNLSLIRSSDLRATHDCQPGICRFGHKARGINQSISPPEVQVVMQAARTCHEDVSIESRSHANGAWLLAAWSRISD